MGEQSGTGGRLAVMALTVNGQLVAAQLNGIDDWRIEGWIMGYDVAFARYAPGRLLMMSSVRWAHRHGPPMYDFRVGEGSYKSIWTNDLCEVASHEFTQSVWGGLRTLAQGRVMRLRAGSRDAKPFDQEKNRNRES
jgi:CelD/BcsL family acetyltransferase involved in cellulose biosynthesis